MCPIPHAVAYQASSYDPIRYIRKYICTTNTSVIRIRGYSSHANPSPRNAATDPHAETPYLRISIIPAL